MPAPVNPHKDPADHSIAEFVAKSKKDNTELTSVGDKRLAFMDANQIDKQIMGYGDNSPQNLDPKVSIDLSRMANDDLADAIATHPDRFGGWAVLPVGDPKAQLPNLNVQLKKKVSKGQ